MLVKINNSNEDFSEQIERLKIRYDVGTASGAATQAVLRLMELEERFDLLASKNEKLEIELEDIKRVLVSKARLERQIDDFIN